MSEPSATIQRAALEAEITSLRQRLESAESTLRTISAGIDALVDARPNDDVRVPPTDDEIGRRCRRIAERMSIGAVMTSPHGDIVYTNPAFAAMVGMTTRELLGRRFADLVAESDRRRLELLARGEAGAEREIALRRSGGSSVPVSLTAIADETGISFVVTDLSLVHRLDEAEETLRAIRRGEVDAVVIADGHDNAVELFGDAHRHYRLLVERMQQGAVTTTSTGDILYANQPFATMLDRPIETLLGRPLAELVVPEERTLLEALLSGPRGGATQHELMLMHASGTEVPVLASTALLPDEGGVCLIVTDLTAQRAYEAVVASHTLERSILEQAADGIVVCDPAGRVTRASRAACELCMENPLLQPFAACFVLDSPSGPPDLNAVLRGAVTLRGKEYTLRRRNAPDAVVLLSASAVVDANQQIGGCVVTLTEITERRRNEDRLREEDRRKTEFLAILAHELRNPLAPIRSAVEILRVTKNSLDRTGAYALDIISRQSANLVRLVDDLLDVNRISQGKVELKTENLDMRTVVADAADSARPMFASRGQVFTVTTPDIPMPIAGDAVRLTQIIANLLGNAAKFTPRGGTITLSLEPAATERVAIVTVKDNGIGIDADVLTRIFEPYHQGSLSKERPVGGLGLGLTVARRLAEMHGGSIEATSDGIGCGAEFVVRLPLCSGASTTPARAPPAGRNTETCLDILVVDDNRDAAESLSYVLEVHGHRVQALASGAAAIAAASVKLPDAVLLDIAMPAMDGHEVARRLRQIAGNRPLLLIAMTGYGSADDRQRSRDSSIDYHLVKPVDFEELQRLLATVAR